MRLRAEMRYNFLVKLLQVEQITHERPGEANMALTSKITAYDPSWPQQYGDEVTRLTPIFAQTLFEVHHVGSTAVSGLAAKPEIDVLVVVNDCGNR